MTSFERLVGRRPLSRTGVIPTGWIAAASSVELASVVVPILAVVLLTGIAAEIVRLVYHHIAERRESAGDPLPSDD